MCIVLFCFDTNKTENSWFSLTAGRALWSKPARHLQRWERREGGGGEEEGEGEEERGEIIPHTPGESSWQGCSRPGSWRSHGHGAAPELPAFPKGCPAASQALQASLPLISIQVSVFLAVVIIRNYLVGCSSRSKLEGAVLLREAAQRGAGMGTTACKWDTAQSALELLALPRHASDYPQIPLDELFSMRNFYTD